MKKIMFIFCLVLGAYVHAADVSDGKAFQFGYIPQMRMWEKNAENMKNKVSWKEFQDVEQAKPDLFYEYHLGNEKYVKLPGFGSEKVNGNQEDGSCFWTHLGIKPEKMYTLLTKMINDIQDRIVENPDFEPEYAQTLVELFDFLDPKEEVSQEDMNNNLVRLETIIKKDDVLRKNWLQNVKKHGGTDFSHKGKNYAFRPLNSEMFLQYVANELKINITIFVPLEPQVNALGVWENKLAVSSKITTDNASDTLYLLNESNGFHYDVLVPKGQPVSEPVFKEMMFYLDFIQAGFSKDLWNKTEKFEEAEKVENVHEEEDVKNPYIKEDNAEENNEEDQPKKTKKIAKEKNILEVKPQTKINKKNTALKNDPKFFDKNDEDWSMERVMDGKPDGNFRRNPKRK